MVTVISVNIGLGNGLVPIRHQAITWTNADLPWVTPSGIYTKEISVTTYQALKIKSVCIFYPESKSFLFENSRFLPQSTSNLPNKWVNHIQWEMTSLAKYWQHASRKIWIIIKLTYYRLLAIISSFSPPYDEETIYLCSKTAEKLWCCEEKKNV